MLGLEVEALKAASLISANHPKVHCAGAERQRYSQSQRRPEENAAHDLLVCPCRVLQRRDRRRLPPIVLLPLDDVEIDTVGCGRLCASFEQHLAGTGRDSRDPFPTASLAAHQSSTLSSAALDALQEDIRIQSLSVQSKFSGPDLQPINSTDDVVAIDDYQFKPQHTRRPSAGRNLLARKNNQGLLQSPFRIHARPAETIQPPRPAPARLWNPTNSTPRASPARRISTRRRRPSTPPPPPAPLGHPAFNFTTDSADRVGTGSGDSPLLAPPPRQPARLAPFTRASLHIEGRASIDRISLPKSVRHSYDDSRNSAAPPPRETVLDYSPVPPIESRSRTSSFHARARALSFGLIRPEKEKTAGPLNNPGKGKKVVIMTPSETVDPRRSASRDLERGPNVLDPRHSTTLSLPDDIGSVISSSDSSIMGDPDQPDMGEAWGPQHPCFPHLNPHVPLNSAEFANTRVIRVRRDWLVQGDLAPTFSNLYPEILDPAGVSEQEFRRVIEKLNAELVPVFNPYNWRNIVDGVLGLLTGWVWDDLGLTNTKSRLRSLESWIEKWNVEMEKTLGSEEGAIAPRMIPLRRTGYMNLDIQIPDPEIAPAASQPTTRSGPPESVRPATDGHNDTRL